MLPSALVLDAILMLSNSLTVTSIFGGMAFALLFYPTNWPIFGMFHVPVEYGGAQLTVADLSRRLRVTLLLGSLPERVPGDARVRNTSVLLGPDGATLAVYRKIHLFDIDLAGKKHKVILKEFQLEPEQSTSAIIVHHPEAKYFNIG